MRGSPFAFSNFSMGLNALDSPYMLKTGEARDVLNMQSTLRGAIRKRFGSTQFAGGSVPPGFPGLAVTDSFIRANEKPLSNAGKWTAFTGLEKGEILNNHWSHIPHETHVEKTNSLAQNSGTGTAWSIVGSTASATGTTRVLALTQFGFAVPAGAEVVGVIISFEGNMTVGGTWKAHIYNNGTLAGTEHSKAVAAGVQTITFGSSVDTWGTGLGVNNLEFGIGLQAVAGSGVASVTLPATMTVYYKFANEEGAYWNVAEQTNPATSVEVLEDAKVGDSFGVRACIDATATKWYEVRSTVTGAATSTVKIVKENAGISTVLAESAQGKFGAKTKIGISVRAGVVTAWYNDGATWFVTVSANDATYTKGFSGIISTDSPVASVLLNNFSVGETAAPTELALCTSIGQANIGGTRYLLVTAGTNLYSINASAEVTIIKEGLTEGTRWSIFQATSGSPNRVIADGPIYLSNGVDAPLYWSGATKATAAAAWTAKAEGEFVEVPKAKYLIYHNARIWAAGISGAESAVRFSGLAERAGEGFQVDPTSWPKANIMQFEQADGTELTGLATTGIYVLVFKPHKIWAIFSTATEEGEGIRQISENVGCISHRSIVETEGGTYFLTPDKGVYVTNGVSVREISQQVRPILQGTDYRASRAAKLDKLETASAGFLNGHYYLSYTAKDGSRKTLDYDVLLKSWWLHDIAGEQWIVWGTSSNESSLFTIPAEAKKGVYRTFVQGVYTDGGEVYKGGRGLSCYWVSSWEPFWQYFMRHRFQQPQVKKRVHQMFVDGRGVLSAFLFTAFNKEPLELQGVIDNADMAKPAASLTLSDNSEEPEPEYKAARFYSLGAHRVFSIMFGNNTIDRLEVTAYAMDLSFRKS